jgi:hypothetical protein
VSSPPRNVSTVLSALMVVIGVTLIVRALAAGGGITAIGVILGVLFIAAGAGRLWVGMRVRDR